MLTCCAAVMAQPICREAGPSSSPKSGLVLWPILQCHSIPLFVKVHTVYTLESSVTPHTQATLSTLQNPVSLHNTVYTVYTSESSVTPHTQSTLQKPGIPKGPSSHQDHDGKIWNGSPLSLS